MKQPHAPEEPSYVQQGQVHMFNAHSLGSTTLVEKGNSSGHLVGMKQVPGSISRIPEKDHYLQLWRATASLF